VIKELIKKAREAQQKAYSPYSKFKVGAALLTKSGKIYQGCNVENASYSLTVCAERVAIFKAVSDGETEFETLVITSSAGDFTPPCGACRQVMSEFGDFYIVMANSSDDTKTMKVSELLPGQFKFNKE